MKNGKGTKKLSCGCPPILDLAVRTYRNGQKIWGYACKCGKVFIKKGTLKKNEADEQ